MSIRPTLGRPSARPGDDVVSCFTFGAHGDDPAARVGGDRRRDPLELVERAARHDDVGAVLGEQTAVAAPIPVPPPVTMATRPSSDNGEG